MRVPPPVVLREYALLADGERGAIVGPHGDITWMCAPSWHSPAVFSSLMGGAGIFTVTPRDPYVWGGYYEDGTLIWHGRWVTHGGIVESREALAYPGDEHRVVLLRRLHAVDGPADLEVRLRPRAGYDRSPMRDLEVSDGVWTMRCGSLRLRFTCGSGARHVDEELTLAVHLEAGESRDLVLEVSDQALPDSPAHAHHAWRSTEAAWASAVTVPDTVLSPRDTRHSLAVVRGLTSRTGGTVAAATTSLPERSEAGRNYDYRYVWVRDQCFVGRAAAATGNGEMLDAAASFIAARLLADGDALAPAYTIGGERVPPQRSLTLPGYPGGCDVVGNDAGSQFQLDAFGEALGLFAEAATLGRLDRDGEAACEVAAAAIERCWQRPDAGIWELDNRQWTHSRLMASAGLRSVASAVAHADRGRWLALADEILADTARHAQHPSGRWQRAVDDPGLDAALLLAPLRGALPPDDPRALATLRAFADELVVDGYAYRFRHDDRPLPDAEGSFLLCGFTMALALHAVGEDVEARAWYERSRAATGPAAIFSEEYDARQHQMRGNLAQAFVHAIMVEAAATLSGVPAASAAEGPVVSPYR